MGQALVPPLAIAPTQPIDQRAQGSPSPNAKSRLTRGAIQWREPLQGPTGRAARIRVHNFYFRIAVLRYVFLESIGWHRLGDLLRVRLYGDPTTRGLQKYAFYRVDPRTDAALVTDNQDTFKPPRGGLAVSGGDEINGPILEILKRYPLRRRYASKDSHPWGSVSLISSYNPEIVAALPKEGPFPRLTYQEVKNWSTAKEDQTRYLAPHAQFTVAQLQEYLWLLEKLGRPQILWPDHALDPETAPQDVRQRLAENPGLSNALDVRTPESMFHFTQIKGMRPDRDSHDPFADNAGGDTGLGRRMAEDGVKRFVNVGLAGDVCVGLGSLGGRRQGFTVIQIEDAIRSVRPESAAAMDKELIAAGVHRISLAFWNQANEGVLSLLRKFLTRLLRGQASIPTPAPVPDQPQPPTAPNLITKLQQAPVVPGGNLSLEKAFNAFKAGRTSQRDLFNLRIPVTPHQGSYAIAAGLELSLAELQKPLYDKNDIDFLRTQPLYQGEEGRRFLDYLSEFRFTGDIDAAPEGTPLGAGEILVQVRATPVEAALLADVLRSSIGPSTLIATKTARAVLASNGELVDPSKMDWNAVPGRTRTEKENHLRRTRRLLEFGLRRAFGTGAQLASRAAIIGGAFATSHVKAAELFQLPVSGTMAHFWVTLFRPHEQKDAFRAYSDMDPDNSVFLIDTYDTVYGARDAIEVARELIARGEREGIPGGHRLIGVRIDSGDILALSKEVRRMLDEAGLNDVLIVVSGDMDEFKINDLLQKGAPIDTFGVGTYMVTGGKQSFLDLEFEPADSPDSLWRVRGAAGVWRDVRTMPGRMPVLAEGETAEKLLVPFVGEGKRVRRADSALEDRDRSVRELQTVSPSVKRLNDPEPLRVEADPGIDPEMSSAEWERILEAPIELQDDPQVIEDNSEGLTLDLYHLNLLQAAIRAGKHLTRVSFDLFYRTPPYKEEGCNYVIVSGMRFLQERLDRFTFPPERIAYLRSLTRPQVIVENGQRKTIQVRRYDDELLEVLANFRYSGDMDAMKDGQIAFGHEPIARGRGTLIEKMLIESLALNTINPNSLVATRTHILRTQTNQPLISNFIPVSHGRRAALEAAYSAALAGADATTDVAAARLWNIPLADSKTPGIFLGADPATGGPKPALGGVWKQSEAEGLPVIKVSNEKKKASNPGWKMPHEIVDAKGNAVARIIGIDGEHLPLKIGHRAMAQLTAFKRNGNSVRPEETLEEARTRAREYTSRYNRPGAPTQAVRSNDLFRLWSNKISQTQLDLHKPEDRGQRIGLVQINVHINNFDEVVAKVKEHIDQAEKLGLNVLLFQEALLTGYPLKDLINRPDFLASQDRALQEIVDYTRGKKIHVVLGVFERRDSPVAPSLPNLWLKIRQAILDRLAHRSEPVGIFNAAKHIHDGQVVKTVYKHLLAERQVYADTRNVVPGPDPLDPTVDNITEIDGEPFAIVICEDGWHDRHNIIQAQSQRTFKGKPVRNVLWVNASHETGSPIEVLADNDPTFNPDRDVYIPALKTKIRMAPGAKKEVREDLLVKRSLNDGHPLNIFYANAVGGQTPAYFGGRSYAYSGGEKIGWGKFGEEDLAIFEIDKKGGVTSWDDELVRGHFDLSPLREHREIIIRGIMDDIRKRKLTSAVLGLSGGLDSSVVAVLTVEAFRRLGMPAKNVIGVAMPSAISSDHSLEDARALAHTLGITFRIEPVGDEVNREFAKIDAQVADLITTHPERAEAIRFNARVARQNVQARIRMVRLYEIANVMGSLLLNTSNSTESQLGYGTVDGDMAGGLGALLDVPKSLVFAIAIDHNALVSEGKAVGAIPERCLTKPPSAELEAGQTDEASLPGSYPQLDMALQIYQRSNNDLWEMIRQRRAIDPNGTLNDGAFARMLFQILRLRHLAEWKRQQAAAGIVTSHNAHTVSWQMPLLVDFTLTEAKMLDLVTQARVLGFFLDRPAPVRTASYRGGEIRIAMGRFSDGEIHADNLDPQLTVGRDLTVTHPLKSADDLVELLLMLENLRTYGARSVTLRLQDWHPGESTHGDLLRQILASFGRTEETPQPRRWSRQWFRQLWSPTKPVPPFAVKFESQEQAGEWMPVDNVKPLARAAQSPRGIGRVFYIDPHYAPLAHQTAHAFGLSEAAAIPIENISRRLDQWKPTLTDDLRGQDIVLVHSTRSSENIATLLITMMELRKRGVRSIALWNTYAGYGRQDKRWIDGQTIGIDAQLRAIDGLADRHLTVNAHFTDQIENGHFHGFAIENLNGFLPLAISMFNHAVFDVTGIHPQDLIKLSEADRRVTINRIVDEFRTNPIVCVGPDDGAHPLVEDVIPKLREYLKDVLGQAARDIPIHGGFLNKIRLDANHVRMDGPILTKEASQTRALEVNSKAPHLFVLDDETAKGTTLLTAVYVLRSVLNYFWPHIETAVVQAKLTSGVKIFEHGLTDEQIGQGAEPSLSDADRKMAPRRFLATDSLPGIGMRPDQIVSLAPLIPEVVRRILGGVVRQIPRSSDDRHAGQPVESAA